MYYYKCLWEFSAQLLVLSSYILKRLSITKILLSMFYYFFRKQSLDNAQSAFYLYKKSSWVICMDANEEKNIYSSVTGYRTILRKERSKCRETEASDMQHRQKIITLHARKSSLNRHYKISESLCVGQQKSAEILLHMEHSNDMKLSICLFEREFRFQSENLKYLNWIIQDFQIFHFFFTSFLFGMV